MCSLRSLGAPTPTFPANRPGATPDFMSASIESLVDELDDVHFLPPRICTPKAPPNSPADDPQPKVASRLGHGWMTTFPTGASSQSLPSTATSAQTSFTPTFHPKTTAAASQSEYRGGASHGQCIPSAKTFPVAINNPTRAAHLRFDPFGEDDSVYLNTSGSISSHTSTSVSTSCSASTSDELARSITSERDINGVPPCTPEEIGEGRNVYLPNLATTVTERQLLRIGQHYGRVVSVKIERSGLVRDIADPLFESAQSNARTYAFVMFDSPLAAKNFMAKMQQQDIACQYGKETPHLKQKALEDPYSSNLYVAEIPLDATEEEMRSLFAPGIISSLRFLTDDLGNRRGTAMIRLQSRAQADEAIVRLDNRWTMRGCTKKLQVRIADSEHQKQFKRTAMQPPADASEAAMLQQILMIQAELKRREAERGSMIDTTPRRSDSAPTRTPPGLSGRTSRSSIGQMPSAPACSGRWEATQTKTVPRPNANASSTFMDRYRICKNETDSNSWRAPSFHKLPHTQQW